MFASLRSRSAALAGYLVLGLSILVTAGPVAATHNLDGTLYDNTGCAGNSFAFTHEYNSLSAVGWNDRADGIRSYSNGSSGRIHRDDNFNGESKSFGPNVWSDCDLSNNFMAKWGVFDLYWANQASSISET
jgi:hypothetical protein